VAVPVRVQEFLSPAADQFLFLSFQFGSICSVGGVVGFLRRLGYSLFSLGSVGRSNISIRHGLRKDTSRAFVTMLLSFLD
jgi:hypothetical protein